MAHENGYPDLCGGEEVVGGVCDSFNRSHERTRAVFVNQWDWNRQFCGRRMPEDMTLADLRYGSDLEFGLSVYEPFGISQLEPLSAGALCVVSNVCGCVGFARQAGGAEAFRENIIEADYLRLSDVDSVEQFVEMTMAQREEVERAEAARLARIVADRLPRDEGEMRHRIETGFALAQKMNWDRVVRELFLPSVESAASR